MKNNYLYILWLIILMATGCDYIILSYYNNSNFNIKEQQMIELNNKLISENIASFSTTGHSLSMIYGFNYYGNYKKIYHQLIRRRELLRKTIANFDSLTIYIDKNTYHKIIILCDNYIKEIRNDSLLDILEKDRIDSLTNVFNSKILNCKLTSNNLVDKTLLLNIKKYLLEFDNNTYRTSLFACFESPDFSGAYLMPIYKEFSPTDDVIFNLFVFNNSSNQNSIIYFKPIIKANVPNLEYKAMDGQSYNWTRFAFPTHPCGHHPLPTS